MEVTDNMQMDKCQLFTIQQQIDYINWARRLISEGKNVIELGKDDLKMLMLIEENLLTLKLLNKVI